MYKSPRSWSERSPQFWDRSLVDVRLFTKKDFGMVVVGVPGLECPQIYFYYLDTNGEKGSPKATEKGSQCMLL